MAISYDNSISFTVSSSSSASRNLTIASNSNRYLLGVTGEEISAVTYNGTTVNLLTTYTPGTVSGFRSPAIKVWGLANPSTGTNSLEITNSSSTLSSGIAAAVYYDVDPSQPTNYTTDDSNPSDTGTVSSLTSDITTTVDNSWVVGFFGGGSPASGYTMSAGASTTKRTGYNADYLRDAGRAIFDSNGVVSPAGVRALIANSDSTNSRMSSVLYGLKPYLTFSFSGPSSGNVNSASTNFTVTPSAAITGTVTITPSGGGLSTPIELTFSASAAPQTFTITPTDSGTVTLTLTNNVGFYNPSSLNYTANAVVPGAPTIGTAVPANQSAQVAFTAPTSDGGADITSYTATSTPGTITGTGSSSPITVTGLTNGVAYTFKVKATNSVGTGSESSASNSVEPYVAATSFTLTGPSSGNVRSASTNFTVTPNNIFDGTITITPSGAGSTGLSATVLTFNHTSTAQTFTITPLESGSITLTPTNSGTLSNPSNLTYTANAVIPLAPVINSAMNDTSSLSGGRAVINISAPSNDGGADVTSYTITASPGGATVQTSSVGNVTFPGLTNGESYTFTAIATNSVGNSSSSNTSDSVTINPASTDFTNSGPKVNITGNTLSFNI